MSSDQRLGGALSSAAFAALKLSLHADPSSNQSWIVVDQGVTEAHKWDFFLQSHAAIRETARPAHYFVVPDEVFRSHYKTIAPLSRSLADLLEELTQSMCYIYGCATKIIIDILCKRARCC